MINKLDLEPIRDGPNVYFDKQINFQTNSSVTLIWLTHINFLQNSGHYL